MPSAPGIRSTRSKSAILRCRDCDFVKHERQGDDSQVTTSAARYHAFTMGHTVEVVRTKTSVYSVCDTINEDHEYHEKEDLPSNSGSSERDDVAPMGGVRQDAAVVWGRVEREGTCLPAEAQRAHEADVRRTFAISGSFVERLTRHSDNQGQSQEAVRRDEEAKES